MAKKEDAGKELRRMSRRELVELIYVMKQKELELTAQLEQVNADTARFKERLQEKDREIENHWMKLEELMMKIQEGLAGQEDDK